MRPAASSTAVLLTALALAGCSSGPEAAEVEAAAQSVEADAGELADTLERLCRKRDTCPRVRAAELADSLFYELGKGNEVTMYHGRLFHVTLCVVNKKYGAWAYYHTEYPVETYREGEPCTFS